MVFSLTGIETDDFGPALRNLRENKYGCFVILQKSESKLERLNTVEL